MLWQGEDDYFGLGLNWGRPSPDTFGPGLDDRFTLESYYRGQATDFLAISLSIQMLGNPALNPDENLIVVFGLRARIAF